jgi:hypothetical protein
LEEPRQLNLIRGSYGKLLLVFGALGVYFGLLNLLPGLSRALSGAELRGGISELSMATFWLAFFFAGDKIPKNRLKYLGAISIALIVVMVGLIVLD